MKYELKQGVEYSVVCNWKINQLQVSGQGILSNEGMENRGQERVVLCWNNRAWSAVISLQLCYHVFPDGSRVRLPARSPETAQQRAWNLTREQITTHATPSTPTYSHTRTASSSRSINRIVSHAQTQAYTHTHTQDLVFPQGWWVLGVLCRGLGRTGDSESDTHVHTPTSVVQWEDGQFNVQMSNLPGWLSPFNLLTLTTSETDSLC